MNPLLFTIFLAFLPISELRGAIPYALATGYPLYFAYPLCVAVNALVAPLTFLFLSTVHTWMNHFTWYHRMVDPFLAKARHKVDAKVKKYGYWGIMLFVAIPLPVTGAYTGTLGAWILGLGKRRTMAAVFAGVLIAGIIVSAVSVLGIEAFDFFTKSVS